MEIKTILKEEINTIIVEKSKFIAYLFPCDNKQEANLILEDLRKTHYDATHVCYAYIIDDEGVTLYKSSDDGEPSQTAGAPMLNVLKRNELTNVLAVVVRYFGGIKLGAGGLTRTYSNAVIEALKVSTIVTLVDAYKYEMVFNYDRIRDFDRILENNNIEIIDKVYDLQVHYTLLIFDKSEIERLKEKYSYLNVTFEEKEQIVTRKPI